ncbi:MAG: GerMN domain-containing protein [Clostridia bacterium]|nr:GerMN domain-containing protein [Clostridia bacterium]
MPVGGRFLKVVIYLSMLCLLVLSISGCSAVSDLMMGKGGNDKDTPEEEVYAPEDLDMIGVEGEEKEEDAESLSVALFFADDEGKSLVKEMRNIKKTEGVARSTINELISGPTGTGLLPTIPQETMLLDINVKEDGLCIVDFSGELVSGGAAGVIPEELTVYSIVNTLTQFETIDRVQFRLGGQEVSNLGKNIPASVPLMEKTDFIGN